MKKEDVFNFLMEHSKPYCKEKNFKKNFFEFYQDLLKWSFPEDFKFSQKLYHYFNEDRDLNLGICPVCGNRCKFKNFIFGYYFTCSLKCAHNSPEIKEKIKQTNLKRYGVENPFQSEEKKNKIKETLIKKYGCDHPMHCKKIVNKLQQTNLKKYGNVCSLHGEDVSKLVKKNNIEKYGVENAGGSQESLNKIKRTNLERYGCESYVQSKSFKDRYYDEILPKYEQTCLKKFGSKNFSSSNDYRTRQSDIVKKIFQIKKENNSLGKKTKVEEGFEKYLIENDIKYEYQYMSDLYPFKCDFYIIDYDLYIEIQGTWMHGKHPYNKNNENDALLLQKWKFESINKPQYKEAIKVWTYRDPLKRKTAKENNLNWIEVFSLDSNDVINSFINIISKFK